MSLWSDTQPLSQNSTLTIGELGEQFVARWLQTQNWLILHHRWRCRWGEIDLIAQRQQRWSADDKEFSNDIPVSSSQHAVLPTPLLAFVEVKTRSSGNWDAGGRLAITLQKQAKLSQAAQQFLAEYPDVANLPCRFDVAFVSYQRISQNYRLVLQDYIPSAFDGVL